MNENGRIHSPSPALVIAVLALFVALGGTAGAVATQAVPLAKRALTADRAKVAGVADKAKTAAVSENAKRLGGQTPQQLVAQASALPGPASSAAGLVVVKAGTWSLPPGEGNNFTVMCDAGQKVISGGWSDPGDWAASFQSLPTADGAGWTINIWTFYSAPTTQTGSLYAICIR